MTAFDGSAARWRHRLAEEDEESTERRSAMRAANPAFIPRNHLVEETIGAAVNDGDFSPFESLLMSDEFCAASSSSWRGGNGRQSIAR
jgi:uncharacterized protein YdiU (UPF0061 family)